MNLNLLAYNDNHNLKYKIYLKTHEDLMLFKKQFIEYINLEAYFMGEIYGSCMLNKLNPTVNDTGISKYTILVTKHKSNENISVEECPWIILFALHNAKLNKINNRVATNDETLDMEYIYDTINKYTYENKKIFDEYNSNPDANNENGSDKEMEKEISLRLDMLENKVKHLEDIVNNKETNISKDISEKVIYIDEFRLIGQKNPTWRYYYYENGKRKEVKAKNKADLYERLFNMGYTRLDKKNND